MTIEEFIQQLESLVNSKSPLPGEAPLFIPEDIKQDLYSQPSIKAAADQAVVALTGTNSPISAGDIYRIAGMTGEPQLGDPRYDANIVLELPNFLGVPRNYEVDGVSIYTTDDQGEFLFYQSGSEYNLMLGQTPEVVAAVQAELVNSGLLKLGEFVPGKWGGLFINEEQKDVEAFKLILEHSNQTMNPDFTVGLRFFVDNQEAIDAFQPEPAYLPPDYATVSQSVTNLFEQQLRRKPKAYELELLANQLLADTKKAFEAQQPAQLDIGDISAEELLTGNLGNHIVEPPVQEETSIDPTSRMLQKFDDITSKEQERLGANRDIQATNRIILNSITGAPR
jgi:hypothetical protein